MALLLLQLGLCVMSVIQLTSSQPTYDVNHRESDVNSCRQNDEMLSQLAMANLQLINAVSHLTTAVVQLQKDVAELKTGSRQKDAAGIESSLSCGIICGR